MNLMTISPRSGRGSDLRISRSGATTISTEIVNEYKLEGKHLTFAVDSEDESRKFLYIGIDIKGEDPKSIKLKGKSKAGSHQIMLKALASEFGLSKTSKMPGVSFKYFKKITQQALPYFVFERTDLVN